MRVRACTSKYAKTHMRLILPFLFPSLTSVRIMSQFVLFILQEISHRTRTSTQGNPAFTNARWKSLIVSTYADPSNASSIINAVMSLNLKQYLSPSCGSNMPQLQVDRQGRPTITRNSFYLFNQQGRAAASARLLR